MTDPFVIDGFTNVANSGGKTSGMNLFMHLEANGGTLTDKGRCIFTNTGWEHPQTLDFLCEQERRWSVKIDWIEFCRRAATDDELFRLEQKAIEASRRLNKIKRQPLKTFRAQHPDGDMLTYDRHCLKADAVRKATTYANRTQASFKKAELIGVDSYRTVTRETASVNGEPFQELLSGLFRFRTEVLNKPGVIPNGSQRLCTGYLKMKTSAAFARDLWGVKPSEYEVRLGLRADESERIVSAIKAKSNECGRPKFPLDEVGIDKEAVASFWEKQPFGLSLKGYEGNCGGCYMKRRVPLIDLIRRGFFDLSWWEGWERKTNQQFRQDRSFRGLRAAAAENNDLLPVLDDLDNGITYEGGYCSN